MTKSKQLDFSFEAKINQLLTPDEIYESADVELLNDLVEDKRIERKPIATRAEILAEYFSMWANTSPYGGLLAIGYRDDNSLEGCISSGQIRINEMEKLGQTHCPEAKFESKRIAITNLNGLSDFLILIRIHYNESRVVKTHNSKAFIRKGDSKYELKSNEIRELEIDKGQIDFENESCGLPYPSEFDMELIKEYSDNYSKSRGLSNEHTYEDILKISHLGKIHNGKFIPNNACTLLFAKDPRQIFSGCKIRFLRFQGEKEGTGDSWNVEKDIWIDNGSLPKQIVRADEILTAQLREFSRMGKDSKFYTAPEYPKDAWYEAIVNGCVHRSYEQRTMNIFVKMFDDRLEIESPGGFPPFVTPQNIYEMHKPRNPRVMDAMFYLDFVKCAHEGTRRIRDSMLEFNLPTPEFAEKQLHAPVVRVTLRNNVKHRKVWKDKDASGVVSDAMWKILSEQERRVINFIADNGSISVSQVQRLTEKSWHASRQILRGLKTKGLIFDNRKEDTERDPSCRWIFQKS